MKSKQWLTCAWGSLAVLILASTVDAQVLPRNRNKAGNAAPPAATPRADEAPNRANNVAPRAAADAAVDTDETQTRVRTEADARVTRSGAAGEVRTTSQILRSTQLVGTMVSIQRNQQVGKITEIVFNDGGCISYLIVDMGGRMAPIPWQIGNYDFQNRVFILEDFDQARVSRIPTFTNFQQLSEQTFVSQVNEYFGVRADAAIDSRNNRSVLSTETDVNNPRSRTSTEATGKASATGQRSSAEKRDATDQGTSKQSNRGAGQDQKSGSTNAQGTINPRTGSSGSPDAKGERDSSATPKSATGSDNQPNSASKSKNSESPEKDAPSADRDSAKDNTPGNSPAKDSAEDDKDDKSADSPK